MLTTQYSLLARLENAEDQEAWHAFVQLYYSPIFRSLQVKGLQHADAHDLTQQVFMSVAKSLASRPHDPNRARFRTWLEVVIRNTAINAMRAKQRRAEETLDPLAWEQVAAVDDQAILEGEFRRQVFVLAAKEVEAEFEPRTWQAFWRTSIDGQGIDQVACELGMQRGSVYAARSRIIRRLQEVVDRFERKS